MDDFVRLDRLVEALSPDYPGITLSKIRFLEDRHKIRALADREGRRWLPMHEIVAGLQAEGSAQPERDPCPVIPLRRPDPN